MVVAVLEPTPVVPAVATAGIKIRDGCGGGTYSPSLCAPLDAAPLSVFGWVLASPPIRFRSSSTNTAFGWTSFTKFLARLADDSDMCAVPSRYTIRFPRFQTDTVGSQVDTDVTTAGGVGGAREEAVAGADRAKAEEGEEEEAIATIAAEPDAAAPCNHLRRDVSSPIDLPS
jgi:hypothetical protein